MAEIVGKVYTVRLGEQVSRVLEQRWDDLLKQDPK